jgi:hypothetical protein
MIRFSFALGVYSKIPFPSPRFLNVVEIEFFTDNKLAIHLGAGIERPCNFVIYPISGGSLLRDGPGRGSVHISAIPQSPSSEPSSLRKKSANPLSWGRNAITIRPYSPRRPPHPFPSTANSLLWLPFWPMQLFNRNRPSGTSLFVRNTLYKLHTGTLHA